MPRISLGIEYKGTAYHGWQAQQSPQLPTIQRFVEQALSFVADHPITVTCAGRTDAGVHALEQVVHFDTQVERSMHAWVFGANTHLPKDISVLWAKEVDPDFHARFSAKARMYRYVLCNQPIRPAIEKDLVAWHHKQLNLRWMQKAARHFLGEHDFSSFRGADCQAKSPVREVMAFNVLNEGGRIIFEVRANAFLHHMVRNMVGTLMEVGMGRKTPDWVKQLLEIKQRSAAGMMAPASGLYLQKIMY